MGDKRTEKVIVRMSISEKAEMALKAKSMGLNLSDYIRQSVTHVRAWTPEDAAHKNNLRRQISQINNNMNQIARKLNKGESVGVLLELSAIKALLSDLIC